MIWEQIKNESGDYLFRTPIFGGWLVRCVSDVQTVKSAYLSNGAYNNGELSIYYDQNMEWRSSITFVPDPNHAWDLNTAF